MENTFDYDLAAATFAGLSSSRQRRAAALFSILIWLALAGVCITLALRLDDNVSDALALSAFSYVLFHFIFFEKNLLKVSSDILFEYLPLAVLVRRDSAVIDKARSELLNVAARLDFKAYLDYGKINPEIRSKQSLLVMAHQEKGDLETWTLQIRNLRCLADLVFQIHLTQMYMQGNAIEFQRDKMVHLE